jgi:hypothetical protein
MQTQHHDPIVFDALPEHPCLPMASTFGRLTAHRLHVLAQELEDHIRPSVPDYYQPVDVAVLRDDLRRTAKEGRCLAIAPDDAHALATALDQLDRERQLARTTVAAFITTMQLQREQLEFLQAVLAALCMELGYDEERNFTVQFDVEGDGQQYDRALQLSVLFGLLEDFEAEQEAAVTLARAA